MSLRVAAILLTSMASAACDAGKVHPFGAYPYDVVRGCLEPAGAVDVIDGPDPGTCPGAHCWVTPSGDIYVSDQACDAPLDYRQSTSGPCKLALEAYKSNTRCAADNGAGGS